MMNGLHLTRCACRLSPVALGNYHEFFTIIKNYHEVTALAR